jgi:adenylate kinase family enzyme
MKLCFLQGSGKGTLSARLVQKYDLEFVASGDVLRREIMKKSEVGRLAEEIVASGGEFKTKCWGFSVEKWYDN